MAVNTSRSMRAELEQGVCDNTFMQLQQDWSLNANPPVERLAWPAYANVERHQEACRFILTPISPREKAPPGGMYHIREKHGVHPLMVTKRPRKSPQPEDTPEGQQKTFVQQPGTGGKPTKVPTEMQVKSLKAADDPLYEAYADYRKEKD